MSMRGPLAFVTLSVLCGCAAGIGPQGGYLVQHGPDIKSAGVKATALGDLAMMSGPALAGGIDAEVAQRVGPHQDAWGQWHLLTLVGFAHLPRPNECMVGYEALLTPGIARTYAGNRPVFGWAMGTQLGLPLRLSASQPPWRTDDLVALDYYLVPSVSATWFGDRSVAVSAALTLQVAFWSTLAP